MNHKPYKDLKTYLVDRYGEVVYRVPIDAGFDCPNRDGTVGVGGCIYCDPTGSGFTVDKSKSIVGQLESRIKVLKTRNISKYMAYFQANSNTYATVDELRELYESAIIDGVKILDISTRPDLVPEEVLCLLDSFSEKVDIFLEFGLQTANPVTLRRINRGHGLSHFIDAVQRASRHNVEIIAHVIVNLPWDTIDDVIETAEVISLLGVQGVKLHSLYIVEGTVLGDLYKSGEIELCSLEDYIERVVTFLEYLSPDVVIHRLVAEPPDDGTLFGNWGLRKIQLINIIEKKMIDEKRFQGSKYRF